ATFALARSKKNATAGTLGACILRHKACLVYLKIGVTQFGASNLRQSGIPFFFVCGFPRYARKTAHKRKKSTMLPQAKKIAALRCGITQMRKSYKHFQICQRLRRKIR